MTSAKRVKNPLEDGAYQVRRFREQDQIISPTFPNLQLTAEQILSAGR